MLTQLIKHTGYFIRLESSFDYTFSGNILANALISYLEYHAARELDLTDEEQLLNIPDWCYAGQHSQRRLINRLLGICKSRQYLADIIQWLKSLLILKTEEEKGKTTKYWLNIRKLQEWINQKIKVEYKPLASSESSKVVAAKEASSGRQGGQLVAAKEASSGVDTYIQIDQVINTCLVDPHETPQTPQCNLGDIGVAEIPQDHWGDDCKQETPIKPNTHLAPLGKNNPHCEEKSSEPCSTNEKTARDKLKSLYRRGFRQWNKEDIDFLQNQLDPFRAIWNENKFATFYPVTKLSKRYLYFLLDFLIREDFEDCLETFEKAVRALAVDPFWTGQSKQKPNDCLDISFLLENPDAPEFKDRIRIYSDRYRETPQGHQINQQDVENAIRQKKIQERVERMTKKFGNQGA